MNYFIMDKNTLRRPQYKMNKFYGERNWNCLSFIVIYQSAFACGRDYFSHADNLNWFLTFIYIQVKRQSNEADPTKAGTTVLDTQCSHSVLDLCSGRIRSIRLKLRGTSKFSGAEELLVEAVRCQELSVRKVLAYGTKHGLGVFCMLLSGEKQIGWIPETRKSV